MIDDYQLGKDIYDAATERFGLHHTEGRTEELRRYNDRRILNQRPWEVKDFLKGHTKTCTLVAYCYRKEIFYIAYDYIDGSHAWIFCDEDLLKALETDLLLGKL